MRTRTNCVIISLAVLGLLFFGSASASGSSWFGEKPVPRYADSSTTELLTLLSAVEGYDFLQVHDIAEAVAFRHPEEALAICREGEKKFKDTPVLLGYFLAPYERAFVRSVREKEPHEQLRTLMTLYAETPADEVVRTAALDGALVHVVVYQNLPDNSLRIAVHGLDRKLPDGFLDKHERKVAELKERMARFEEDRRRAEEEVLERRLASEQEQPRVIRPSGDTRLADLLNRADEMPVEELARQLLTFGIGPLEETSRAYVVRKHPEPAANHRIDVFLDHVADIVEAHYADGKLFRYSQGMAGPLDERFLATHGLCLLTIDRMRKHPDEALQWIQTHASDASVAQKRFLVHVSAFGFGPRTAEKDLKSQAFEILRADEVVETWYREQGLPPPPKLQQR